MTVVKNLAAWMLVAWLPVMAVAQGNQFDKVRYNGSIATKV